MTISDAERLLYHCRYVLVPEQERLLCVMRSTAYRPWLLRRWLRAFRAFRLLNAEMLGLLSQARIELERNADEA